MCYVIVTSFARVSVVSHVVIFLGFRFQVYVFISQGIGSNLRVVLRARVPL